MTGVLPPEAYERLYLAEDNLYRGSVSFDVVSVGLDGLRRTADAFWC